jgi:phosphoenolpyruvate-protein kinase (PTS system EI component)
VTNWSEWTEADVEKHNARVGAKPSAPSQPAEMATQPKPSKYRNVKTVVDGIAFDSKREAYYFTGLKLRERAGDITDLKRQVRYSLYAPDMTVSNADITVSHEISAYVADFTFTDSDGVKHIVDAKGKRTAMYILKAKWMRLQYGIEIEEV